MSKHRARKAACGATLWWAVATAWAIEFTDPRGDDRGPGGYVYPTDGLYSPGVFDLTRLTINKVGSNVQFAVEMASALEDRLDTGAGFSLQWVFVFIKSGAGGHADTLPGLNLQFAAGHEWNKVVVLTSVRKSRVLREVHTKVPAALAKDVVVPNVTRGEGRTIKGSVPLSDLAGDGNIERWGYQVVVQSFDFSSGAAEFPTRKVNAHPSAHSWGGGHDGDCDPHTPDVLDGPSAEQADMLEYECGPNGEALRRATLLMVRK